MYIAKTTPKVNIDHFSDGEYVIEKVSTLPQLNSDWEFMFEDPQEVENFNFLETFVCKHNNQIVGLLCGTNGTDTNLRAFANHTVEVFLITKFCAKDKECAKFIFDFAGRLAIARYCNPLQFDSTTMKQNLKTFCKDELGFYDVDKYIFKFATSEITISDEEKEIRPVYCGEEYDVSKEPLYIEEGENILGYMEETHMSYNRCWFYVGLKKNNPVKHMPYFGYIICEFNQKEDPENPEELFNQLDIKDIYIYDDNSEYWAEKLFEYIEQVAKRRYCKYISLKVSEKRFSPMYEFCKNNIKMQENNGYLTKTINP